MGVLGDVSIGHTPNGDALSRCAFRFLLLIASDQQPGTRALLVDV